MALNEMAAPCGLFCGACPLFLAAHNSDIAEKLAARFQTTPDKVVCTGCRPMKGCSMPLHGKTCGTFECAEKKGFNFCYECGDFPCDKLAPAADQADELPHNSKVFNLLRIKRDGLESWVEHYPSIMNRYFKGVMKIGEGPSEPDKK